MENRFAVNVDDDKGRDETSAGTVCTAGEGKKRRDLPMKEKLLMMTRVGGLGAAGESIKSKSLVTHTHTFGNLCHLSSSFSSSNPSILTLLSGSSRVEISECGSAGLCVSLCVTALD